MRWNTRPARKAKHLPDGFILPCRPKKAVSAPTGEGWLHEIKHDGYRVICRIEGGAVRIWSRHATSWTERLVTIRTAAAALPPGTVLDGEAVAHDPDGRQSLSLLASKSGAAGAVLFAFDLLSLAGEDLRDLPLRRRRMLLAELLRQAGPGLTATEHLDGPDGPAMFDHACRLGMEGIISKKADSSYRSGPSDVWLKVKNPRYGN